jgi:hypothetical protein
MGTPSPKITRILRDFRRSSRSSAQGGECVEVAEVVTEKP